MPDPADTPSVLAVLVVRGGTDVREALGALSAQTHQKLGVLGVDAGASQEARELLVQALGQGRVITVAGGKSSVGSSSMGNSTSRISATRDSSPVNNVSSRYFSPSARKLLTPGKSRTGSIARRRT